MKETVWHPILAAIEIEPALWHMTAQFGTCYGIVRLLEVNGERGYRAVTWGERPEDRELIGYYRTLRAATEAAHAQFVRAHGQQGPPRT